MKKLTSALLTVVLIAVMFVPLVCVRTSGASFAVRTTAPDANNLYYIKTTYGGYNPCILGSSGYYSALGISNSKGSVLPNCVGYAFGRAYEVLGSRPNLSTGNARDWYSYNQTHGYYPYGSTPKVGSIACWSTNHVAFVEKVEGNNIVISESNWGASPTDGRYWRTRTISASTSSLQGYIYVCGGDDPATPTVSANGKKLAVGDTVTFSFNAPGANSIYFGLYRDGEMYFNGEFDPSVTYSRSLTATGHYAFYIVAHYSSGNVESVWDDFDVYNDLSAFVPAKPDLWVTSNRVMKGQPVEIFQWSEQAMYYSVAIYKDGVLLINDYYYTSSEQITIEEDGKYMIAATAINQYGESDFNTCEFTVYSSAPAKPDLWVTSNRITKGQPIEIFQWSELAMYYSVAIYKDGVLLTNDYYYTSSEQITIEEEGKYLIAATAINQYGESDFNTCEFSVISSLLLGDVTGDGKLNSRDVVALMKLMLTPNPTITAANDINSDGKLNSRDVIALMKLILAQA